MLMFKLHYFQVVLVQTNKKNNLWARGIIYTYKFENSYPEIYFIDSQVNRTVKLY